MSRIVSITGRRGKGKTSLAVFIACGSAKPVVIFDPTMAIEQGQIVHSVAEFESALEGEQSPIVFQPVSGPDADLAGQFAGFIEALRNVRNIAIVIDESSYLQSPNRLDPALDDELRCGRRRQHDVYLTQHRMQDQNGLVLSLVTDFRFFQSKHPRDLEKIAEYASPQIAQLASELHDYEFLGYHVESGSFWIHMQPETWRLPSASAANEAASPAAALN